jgi:hypothetical protein
MRESARYMQGFNPLKTRKSANLEESLKAIPVNRYREYGLAGDLMHTFRSERNSDYDKTGLKALKQPMHLICVIVRIKKPCK